MKESIIAQDSVETFIEDLLHIQGYVLQELLGVKLSFERAELNGMASPGDSYPMTLYNYVYPSAGEFPSYWQAITRFLGLNSRLVGLIRGSN